MSLVTSGSATAMTAGDMATGLPGASAGTSCAMGWGETAPRLAAREREPDDGLCPKVGEWARCTCTCRPAAIEQAARDIASDGAKERHTSHTWGATHMHRGGGRWKVSRARRKMEDEQSDAVCGG